MRRLDDSLGGDGTIGSTIIVPENDLEVAVMLAVVESALGRPGRRWETEGGRAYTVALTADQGDGPRAYGGFRLVATAVAEDFSAFFDAPTVHLTAYVVMKPGGVAVLFRTPDNGYGPGYRQGEPTLYNADFAQLAGREGR